MVLVPLEAVTEAGKLDLIYRTQLEIKELTMALQDQVNQLTTEVANVRAALTSLQTAVDAEQAQVAAALNLLTADNPDIAAAIASLQAGQAEIAATQADVESTIPDNPTP